jgi:sulfoxide reductase catalytic subunit YedY
MALKKIKSIVLMEFTAEQPRTFWNTVVSQGDDLIAYVDQQVPHPRWSQATERIMGTDERVPAQ